MRVRVIKKQTIEDYCKMNVQSKVAFEIWLAIVKGADWDNPSDIKLTFNSADILGNSSERVIFNIGGNKYRIICTYHFGKRLIHLFVKWIGSHAEYTKLCTENMQYSVDNY